MTVEFLDDTNIIPTPNDESVMSIVSRRTYSHEEKDKNPFAIDYTNNELIPLVDTLGGEK